MTHKPMHMKPEEDVISPQPDPAVSSFLQGTAERPGDLLKYYGAVQSSDVYGDHQGNLKDTKPNFPSDYTPEERRFLYGGGGISTILSDDRLSPGVKYRAAERMFKEMDNNELYEANSNSLRTFMSMIPIAGTVGNLAKTVNVYDSAKKIENNTATDVDYLVVAKEIEYQRRLAEESGASKAFRGFLGSLGFVGEFVASGGTAGLVKTGITKITGKALQRGAQQVAKEATERAMANGIARVAIQGGETAVAKATAKQLMAQGVAKETAEKLAKEAAERATLHASQGLIKRSVREGTEMLGDTALRTVQPSFVPRIGESTTSRMTPEFDTESWTGKLVVEEGDHWMLALPKGIIDTGIEVLSEQLGEKFLPAVGKAISSSAGKMTSKVFPKRFKETFRQNLIDDLLKRSGRPVSQSSRNQILKTMGINGIISEFSEERMAEIMHGTAAAIYGEQGNFGMTGEVLSGEFGAAAESMAIEAPTLAAFQIPGIAASTTQQAREGRRKEAERRAEEQADQRIRETIDAFDAVQIDPADRLRIRNEDPSRSVFESITVDIDGKKVPLSRLFTRQRDRQLVKRMLQDGKGLDEAIVSVRERIAEEGLAGDRLQQDVPDPPVTEPVPQQPVETQVTEETPVTEEKVLSDEQIEGMNPFLLVQELEGRGLKPTGDADNMRNQLREALRPPVEEAVEEDVQEPATQPTTPPPVPVTPDVTPEQETSEDDVPPDLEGFSRDEDGILVAELAEEQEIGGNEFVIVPLAEDDPLGNYKLWYPGGAGINYNTYSEINEAVQGVLKKHGLTLKGVPKKQEKPTTDVPVEEQPAEEVEDKSQVAYRTIRNMSHGLSNVSPPELLDHLPEGFRGTRQQENRPMTILLPEAFEREKDADAQQKIADAYSSLIGDLESFEGASDAEIKAGLNRLLEDHGKPAGARRGVFTPMKDRDVLRIKPEAIRNEAIQGLNEAKKGKLHKTLMAMGNPIPRVPATTEVAPEQAPKPVTGAKPELTRESVQAAIDGNHRKSEVKKVRMAAIKDGWFHEVKAKELTRSYKAGDKKYEFQLQGKKYVKNPDKWEDAKPEQAALERQPAEEVIDDSVEADHTDVKEKDDVEKDEAGLGEAEARDTEEGSQEGKLPDQGSLPRGHEQLSESLRSSVEAPALTGLPVDISIPGYPDAQIGPSNVARVAAAVYMQRAGLEYNPVSDYAPLDKERAARIADWFENGVHDPTNPDVIAAYEALKKETLAQWEVIKETGLEVEWIDFDSIGDPYAETPRQATEDIVRNNHFWVFPTISGFGSSELDVSDNPLLEMTGEIIDGKEATYNDIFRIVHDYFGHTKEGVGFRANGEENAWRVHMAMYTPLARKAATTELRGQNSWVNYGHHGEANRTASAADTVYADQKVMIAPDWVVNEGSGQKPIPKKKGDPTPKAEVKPKTKKGAKGESSIKRLTPAENDLIDNRYDDTYSIQINDQTVLVYKSPNGKFMAGWMDNLVNPSGDILENGHMFNENSIVLGDNLGEAIKFLKDSEGTAQLLGESQKDIRGGAEKQLMDEIEKHKGNYDSDLADKLDRNLDDFFYTENFNAEHDPSVLTKERVREMFPTAQEIRENEEFEGWEVVFDRGILIVKSSDRILLDLNRARKHYKHIESNKSIHEIKDTIGEAGGCYIRGDKLKRESGINTLGMIIISKNRTPDFRISDVLLHEALHFAHLNHLFSDTEWRALVGEATDRPFHMMSNAQQGEAVAHWVQDMYRSRLPRAKRKEIIGEANELLKQLEARKEATKDTQERHRIQRQIDDVKDHKASMKSDNLFKMVMRKLSQFFDNILRKFGYSKDNVEHLYQQIVSGNLFSRLNERSGINIKEYDIHERFGDGGLASYPNALEAQFVHHFGTTKDPKDSRFILPNGEFLNIPSKVFTSKQIEWESPDLKMVHSGFLKYELSDKGTDGPMAISISNNLLEPQVEALRRLWDEGYHNIEVTHFSRSKYREVSGFEIIDTKAGLESFLKENSGEFQYSGSTKIERHGIFPPGHELEYDDFASLEDTQYSLDDINPRTGRPYYNIPVEQAVDVDKQIQREGYLETVSNDQTNAEARQQLDNNYVGTRDGLQDRLESEDGRINAIDVATLNHILADFDRFGSPEQEAEFYGWVKLRRIALGLIARALQISRGVILPQRMINRMTIEDMLDSPTAEEQEELDRLNKHKPAKPRSSPASDASNLAPSETKGDGGLGDISDPKRGDSRSGRRAATEGTAREGGGAGTRSEGTSGTKRGAKGEGTGTRAGTGQRGGKGRKAGKGRKGGKPIKRSKKAFRTKEGKLSDLERLLEKINNRIENLKNTLGKDWDLSPEGIEEISKSERKTLLLIEAIVHSHRDPQAHMESFLKAYFYASILSGTRTHTKNFWSNAIFAPLIRKPSKAIARVLASLIDALPNKSVLKDAKVMDKGTEKGYLEWLKENPERYDEYLEEMMVVSGSAFANAMSAWASGASILEEQITGTRGEGKLENPTLYFDKHLFGDTKLPDLVTRSRDGVLPHSWKNGNGMQRLFHMIVNGTGGIESDPAFEIQKLKAEKRKMVQKLRKARKVNDTEGIKEAEEWLKTYNEEIIVLKGQQNLLGRWWKGTSGIMALPGKALQASDDFFKTFFMNQAVGIEASALARRDQELMGDRGMSEEELKVERYELIHLYITERTSEAWRMALGDAKTSLYQLNEEELKERGKKLTAGAMKSARGVNKIHFFGTFLNAFVKTPVNFYSSGLERVPFIGLVGTTSTVIDNWKHKRHWANNITEGVASQVYILTTYFAFMALLEMMSDDDDEVISGAGHLGSPAERSFTYGDGMMQNNMFRIGGNIYDASEIDPTGLIYGMTRSLMNGENMADALLESTNDKTFLRGIRQFVEMFGADNKRDYAITSFFSAFIPNFHKQLRRFDKDYIADKSAVESGWDKFLIQNQMGGEEYPIYDAWGNRAVRRQGGGLAGILYNSFVPIKYKGADIYKGNKIFVEYNKNLETTDQTWMARPRSSYTKEGETVKLDPNTFAQWQVKQGATFKKLVDNFLPDEIASNPSEEDIKLVKKMREKVRDKVKEAFENGVLSATDESQLYHEALDSLRETDVWKKNIRRWRAADGT